IVFTLVLALAIGVLVARRYSQPEYTSAGNGIALGPATNHPRSVTDFIAQIATGALDTAAGNAGAVLPELGELTPTPQEQALLDLTNADRTRFGLPPVAFDVATLRVARVRAAAQIPDGPL